MTYALLADNSIAQYPYDLGLLQRNVSLPEGFTAETLADHSVVVVAAVTQPPTDHTQDCIEGAPENVNGEWRQTWLIQPASPETIVYRTDSQAEAVRYQRNARLASSDWTQAGDAAAAGVSRQAWAQYRQLLRDVPLQPGFPWNVQWPTEPAPPPPAPTPQWVQFGAALASDAQVNAMIATAATAAPVLHLMLGVGLGQAAQGDPQTFVVGWASARAAGLVSAELAAHVATVGAGYDLPADFLAQLEA